MCILLARHGETPWNAEGRYQGQEDIPLSEVGIAQARALGERLREVPITRAVASPLGRARQTAEFALGDRDLLELQRRIVEHVGPALYSEWRAVLEPAVSDAERALLFDSSSETRPG